MASASLRSPLESAQPVEGDESELGSVTTITLVGALSSLILVGLLVNQGLSVYRKLNRENAVEAVSVSLGELLAETLDGVTTLNHQAGESLATVVVAVAAVGRHGFPADLPAPDRTRLAGLDAELAGLAAELDALGEPTADTAVIRGPLSEGGAIGQAKIALKAALALSYRARLGEFAGPVAADGPLLEEWGTLSALSAEARDVLAANEGRLADDIPDLLGTAAKLFDDHPGRAETLLATVAANWQAVATVEPAGAALPLVAEGFDPGEADPVRGVGGSQFVAATWPWVLFDREPWLARLEPLTISGAGAIYARATVLSTAALVAEIYRAGAPTMFVLPGSPGATRGQEAWRDDRAASDRTFAYLTLTYHAPASPLFSGVFGAPGARGGAVAYAQVMAVDPPSGVSSLQDPGASAVYQWAGGWDTLCWASPASAFPYAPKGVGGSPTVRVGWGWRLVPATRLNDSAARLPEPYRDLVMPLVTLPDALQNH